MSDNKIEAIDSYDAMNKKLLAENLPPLSVVSTQNRPAFMQNERESFRTMALAEKLEDLPRAMTSLILQAQAAFRTLKIIQPHGHLQPIQAIQVLEEELARFKLPKLDPFSAGEQLTESLYNLVRLVDFSCAVLDKEMAQPIRAALRGMTFETLRDLSMAFDDVGEHLLAEKFRDYVTISYPKTSDRMVMLKDLENHLQNLMTKMSKKSQMDEDQVSQLNNFILALLEIIRLHTERRQFMATPQA